MTTYAIGDVQGCLNELQALLKHIQFDPDKDTLWFTGDLVNRGPHSLNVLRFVKSLGKKHHVVLGNHDLHFLAIAYGIRKPNKSDTLDELLTAPDRKELIKWLRYRPLLHVDQSLGYVMVHAGLAPCWDLEKAKQLAQEVETFLRSDCPIAFFKNMYGLKPDYWDDSLSGIERLTCITNYLTRMRFCYANGQLDLSSKGKINENSAHLLAWFSVPNRKNTHEKIIFGHWSALEGKTNVSNVYALDTGCGSGPGNCLTAMRLDDGKRFSINCL